MYKEQSLIILWQPKVRGPELKGNKKKSLKEADSKRENPTKQVHSPFAGGKKKKEWQHGNPRRKGSLIPDIIIIIIIKNLIWQCVSYPGKPANFPPHPPAKVLSGHKTTLSAHSPDVNSSLYTSPLLLQRTDCYWQATFPVKIGRVPICVCRAGKDCPHHHFSVKVSWLTFFSKFYAVLKSLGRSVG